MELNIDASRFPAGAPMSPSMLILPTGSKSDEANIASGTAMRKKVVLLLQGGALDTFQCGAWEALSPFIHANGYQLIAVAGASIGAINAALMAGHYHDADRGSGMLLDFWRNKLATLPAPFFPLTDEYWPHGMDYLPAFCWEIADSFILPISIGTQSATCSGFTCTKRYWRNGMSVSSFCT